VRPELIPDLNITDSDLKFISLLKENVLSKINIVLERSLPLRISITQLFVRTVVYGPLMLLFMPSWLYRFTIKSTVWVWWPLIYIGSGLQSARNPNLVHLKVIGSLWAKVNIMLCFFIVIIFVITNFVLDGQVFERNPLLVPIGRILLVDWTGKMWQIYCVIGPVWSLSHVFLVDYASREYQISIDTDNHELRAAVERKFYRIDLSQRLRFVFSFIWCIIAGVQAVLYFNGERCWFSTPPNLRSWAQQIYGVHLPPNYCPDTTIEPNGRSH
jgi:hypothetical protein